jgi:hypothetical protein
VVLPAPLRPSSGDLAFAHFQADAVQDVALAVIGVQPLGFEARSCGLPQIGRLDRLVGGDLLRRAFGEHAALASTMMRSARWNTTRMSCSISTIV